jgi:hypothetical protein
VSTPPPTNEPGHDRHAFRNLAIIIVVAVLVIAFGKALGEGYYFGGCDETANTKHYIAHVLGIKMCRNEHVGPAPTPEAANPEPEKPVSHDYASPCDLYVKGHNAQIDITGPEAVGDCEHFVTSAGTMPWTTERQALTESRTVVCNVTNHKREHATVTDTGSQEYGKEACKLLSAEGWG